MNHLHPDVHAALAALRTAGLDASIEPVDGPGYQIHIPGPLGSCVLIGNPADLAEAGEEPTGYYAGLLAPCGEYIRELYDSRPSDETGARGNTDPQRLATALVIELAREAFEDITVEDGVHVAHVTAATNGQSRPVHDIALPIGCPPSSVRSALAALREFSWRVHQVAPDTEGRPVLRLGDPVGPGAPFSNLGVIDGQLWQAGFDKYSSGEPVWGYRLGNLDSNGHGVYVGAHGPDEYLPGGTQLRAELADALCATLESSGEWRVERGKFDALHVTAVPTAEGQLRTYAVQWNQDVDARSPEEAARLAVEQVGREGLREVEVFEVEDVDRRWTLRLAGAESEA